VSTAAVATATEKVDEVRAAFEALYRESRDNVYAYVAGLLRDRSAAEEVTSQAFERAWRKRRQINRRRGTPRAWLFGIARNAALDELRRRSKLVHRGAPETAPPDPIDASANGARPRCVADYSSYSSKSALRAPQTGQNQSSGMSSKAVPGGTPPSGSPSSGS